MEVWKPVPSLEGIMASSFGRIKLPEWERTMPNGGKFWQKTKPVFGVIMRANKRAKHVYYGYRSRRFGSLKVHQLVCEAFHGPKPFAKFVVIHLDENGLNNVPENLKWGTQKENLNSPRFKEYCKSRIGEDSPVVKGRNK